MEESTNIPKDTTLDVLKKEVGKILGDSGTARYAGYFQEEPNTEWRDEQRIDLIYKMRNSDNAVQAVVNAIKAPIISREWNIESYDDTPKGQEIREYVEQNIFNMQGRTWREFVAEAFCYLEFGHYTFELVFEVKNGKIALRDLAPRIPSSILNWQGPNKQKGITQLLETDEHTESQVFIPIEKLLVLTNDKEGDDLTGRSILRGAYSHWFYKELLYRISSLSADRYGVGVPHIELPDNYNAQDKADAEEGAANMRSSDSSFLVTPPGYKVSILTPEGSGQNGMMLELIEHHNRMIFFGTLSQFIPLGSDGVGSNALSENHANFYINILENKTGYFQDQFNRQVIKRMVDLNYGEQEWYPYITHTPFSGKDMKQLAEIINILTMTGVVEVDSKLKQWARQNWDLPELTDKQVAEDEKKDEAPETTIEETEEDEKKTDELSGIYLGSKPFRAPRKLTMQEHRMNLKELNDQFNEAETSLEDDLTVITQQEIDRYAEQVKKKLDAGDIAAIGALGYLLFGKSREAIAKAIRHAYDTGKIGAAKELGVDRPTTPLTTSQIMKIDIDDWAKGYQYELEQRSREVVKDAVISGAGAAAIASAVKSKSKDDAARMISNMSGTMVGQYVNRGRMTVFEKYLTKIKAFQRTEVLDMVTCNMCLSLDGKVIKPDDPMAHLDITHSNCRGLWVPIYEADTEQPGITGIPKSVTDTFDTVDGRPRVNSFKQLKKPISPSSKEAADLIRRKLGV